VRRGIPSITVSLLLILALFVGLDMSFDLVPIVEAPTIYVDDDNTGPEDGSQANPWNTIQEAVDDASPGDTVFVSNGTYYEDVYINKTINLTGISRDNTTINCSSIGIKVENVDFVNITGFNVENASPGGSGIAFIESNNSLVYNCRVEKNGYGITIVLSNNTIVRDNIASNNSWYHGIYLDRSSNITVKNNTCFNNNGIGIYLFDNSNDNLIIENNCSQNDEGILLTVFNKNNQMEKNQIYENRNYGIVLSVSDNNLLLDNIIINNTNGVWFNHFLSDTSQVFNDTIESSNQFDIYMSFESEAQLTNTSFNKSRVFYESTTSKLIVQWYLHVNVTDFLGNPVPNAKVKIEDNKNGTYNEIFTTDGMGYVRWIPITEYTERDTSGDNIGEKTFFTPNRIIVWNDTLVGYAQPFMNESKTINIVLFNGTLLDLESGWNFISLPRTQSDTNLQTILQSIEKRYDAVQWYNITDANDYWKHYHIAKPPNLNDLSKINHIMGFWLHINDPQGTTLVVFGDKLIANQSITIYPGWNMVGYPSLINREVDSIWTYNATSQKWKEIGIIDYIELGKGYWMHSKVTKVWDVPL
jgi:parallel beta-helix repeat protein